MIINTSRITIIPNSRDEFNIYSYGALTETVKDIKNPRFLDSGFTMFQKGDTLRIVKFGFEKEVEAIIESVITNVDKDTRRVDFTIVKEIILDESGSFIDLIFEEAVSKAIEDILKADKLAKLVEKVVAAQAVNKGVASN